jgi:ParB family chromosome partitioning protein
MGLAHIDISLIDHGTRLREVSEAQVESLMDSISEVGLLNPITVYERPVVRGVHTRQGFGIIAGAHRKVACERLGLTDIAANVVTLSELQRQIAECDENLRGPSLGKADRALFTQRRKEAYEALHPEVRAGHAGATARHDATANFATASFAAATAEATGQSERTVRLDAERGKKISERALDMLRDTRLDTGTYLDGLKALDHSAQVEKVKADLAKPKAAPQRASIKPEPEALTDEEAEEKQWADFLRVWNRCGAPVRQRIREHVDAPIMDGRYAA